MNKVYAHKQLASPHTITKTPPHTQIAHPQPALPQQPCQQKTAPPHTVNNTPSCNHSVHHLQTKPLLFGNRTPSQTHGYQQQTTVTPNGTRTPEPIKRRMPLHTGNRTPLTPNT